MYSQKTVLPIKLSASYLPNNLSVLSQYDNIAYAVIHRNVLNIFYTTQPSKQIVFNPESYPNIIDFRTTQPNPFIQQAKWCTIGTSVFLVLCCYHMVLIYDKSADNLLSVQPTSYPTDKSESSYSKGITSFGNYLYIGWGNSEVIVYEMKEKIVDEKSEFSFEMFATLKGHSVPIACVYADSTDCLVSGDEDGTVCVWKLNRDVGISNQIPNVVVKGGGDPCSDVCTCGDYLIASFGSGKILIFSIETFERKFEINAHARWINSMDICVKNQRLIAVSEDTCVSVWQIPRDKSGLVECLYYQAVQSYVLTGCRFLDEDGNCFALTAFDYAEVLVYQLDSNC